MTDAITCAHKLDLNMAIDKKTWVKPDCLHKHSIFHLPTLLCCLLLIYWCSWCLSGSTVQQGVPRKTTSCTAPQIIVGYVSVSCYASAGRRIECKNLNTGLGQGSLWLVWLSTVVHDALATCRHCRNSLLTFLSFFLSFSLSFFQSFFIWSFGWRIICVFIHSGGKEAKKERVIVNEKINN